MEVTNLEEVANMAYTEGEQALLRIDQVEQEWRAWGDGVPEGDLEAPPPSGPLTVSLTPTAPSPQNLSPRTQGQRHSSSAPCCSWRMTR